MSISLHDIIIEVKELDGNYRMILVDDEDDVRGRIFSKINSSSGFDVVAKASNGYDALELIEKHNPHIVLTDIKMPFIDGIELARIVRRDYPTTKVAFISGYDEFDFARKAIEYNVISYLMKPVSNEDIEIFFKRLKMTLDQEFDLLSNSKSIQKKLNESLPLLINSYLSSYRNKGELSNDDINQLKQYDLNFFDGNYLVGVIELEGFHEASILEEEKYIVQSYLDKIFKDYSCHQHFLIPEGIVFIIEDSKIETAIDIDLELYELVKYYDKFRQVSLSIGISEVFNDFKEYPKAFRESDEALKHSKYFNLGRIFYHTDIEQKEKKHISINESELRDFEYTLKYGKEDEVKKTIGIIIESKLTEDSLFYFDPQLLLIRLANSLINLSSSINVNISEVIKGNILDALSTFSDLNDLKKYYLNVVMEIRDKNSEKQVNKIEKIIEDVQLYIEKNYKDSYISLETVTSELNISISYLSMLLKKHSSITFNKQLINYRMEKAKELLKYTDNKIIIISKLCGYNEVYYFSHSFKKYTGVSPKEFRNNV